MKLFSYNFHRQILCPVIALLWSMSVYAESSEILHEVVITAAKSRSLAQELPYTIVKFDRSDLSRKMPKDLVEALTDVPGVMVQKTANGHGSPFIRGFTGYRTLATIDGVRYNNSVYRDGANEYFSLIDTFALDSIELLSGPSSVLYGSDAIGGVLNMRGKSALNLSLFEGQGYLQGSQQYRYGSAGTSHVSRTELSFGRAKQWGFLAGLSLKEFGDIDAAKLGLQQHTGYQEQAFDLRFEARLNENWGVTAAHQSLSQDDVWRTHSTIYAKSFAGTLVGDDLRRLKDQERSFNSIKLVGELPGFVDEVELTLSHQRWHETGHRTKANGEFLNDYFTSAMSGLDLQLSRWGEEITWVYGLDYYQDNVDSGRSDYNSNGSLKQVRIQGPVGDDARYELLGVYGQAEIAATQRLKVILGVRYTDTKAFIGRYENPVSGEQASFKDQWQHTVGSVRVSYSLSDTNEWRLWGGLSQSFRAPNIADLSRYGKSRSNEQEIAATGLNPENFLTYEVGLKNQTAAYQFNGTYYYTSINDFITSVPTGKVINQQIEVTKENSSNGYIQGVELSGNIQINSQWQLFANTTWLEGRLDVYQSAGLYETDAYSRIMPLTTSAGFNWDNLAGDLWLRFTITRAEKADKLSRGDKLDTQRIPLDGTPAYTLVSLRGGWDINERWNVNLGLENLLDSAYRSHGSGSNEAGRGLVFAFQANF